MTSSAAQPITAITEDESWALLSSVTLGRLVTNVADAPDIFPVNFVVQRRTVLIRTAEGTKLSAVAVNRQVAFEADMHDVVQGWSVVVKGVAHVLQSGAEINDAERAQVLPWTATTKQRYIRILPTHITGRRFTFGAEPDDFMDFG
jgi:nitroimidazol reductase NimA-like FMN-containing flavoprotein (pyridoxamine 5'-phosphate oxidase superfamily)